jgi:transcriptional regulator with XRE-family HTH domain
MATIRSNAKKLAQDVMEKRIADGLRLRRDQLGLSVAELAEKSDVSRAMISKIERLEASPTAALLGRLCNGLGITLSSLIASAETSASQPIARAEEQPTWRDPDTGLLRTMVSPRNTGSRTEIVHVELPSGASVKYDAMPQPHYDQHVWVLQGKLTMTFGSDEFELGAGDCMRSRFDVAHVFANSARGACKYLVVIVR